MINCNIKSEILLSVEKKLISLVLQVPKVSFCLLRAAYTGIPGVMGRKKKRRK